MAKSNAEYAKAYRERKKAREALAKAAPIQVQDVAESASESDEPGLIVNVAVADQPTKSPMSLKDRALKFLKPDESKPAAKSTSRVRSKKPGDNLMATLLPTVVASFVATYIQQRVPDPYKPCAPSKQEASAIFGPLMAILARQVEITGKASATTVDLTNSLLCAMVYGSRAYMTYIAIKENENAKPQAQESRPVSFPGSYQTTAPRSNGGGIVSNVQQSGGAGRDASNDDRSRAESDSGDDRDPRDIEADAVRQLLGRDREGRVRLGLLAPAV